MRRYVSLFAIYLTLVVYLYELGGKVWGLAGKGKSADLWV